jgi:hypothetical protein
MADRELEVGKYRYRTSPAIRLEAVRLKCRSRPMIREWLGKAYFADCKGGILVFFGEYGETAAYGDWITKDSGGRCRVWKDSDFRRSTVETP